MPPGPEVLTWAGARHCPSRKSHKHKRNTWSCTHSSDQETEAWRQKTDRNKYWQASYMLDSLSLQSLREGHKEGAHPGALGSRRQIFWLPDLGMGAQCPAPPDHAPHPLSEHAHRGTHMGGQDTVQGALLALLLCLQSPSTNSMPWTHSTHEKFQAELRLKWDPADSQRDWGTNWRQTGTQPCPQGDNIPVCQLTKLGHENPGEWAGSKSAWENPRRLAGGGGIWQQPRG